MSTPRPVIFRALIIRLSRVETSCTALASFIFLMALKSTSVYAAEERCINAVTNWKSRQQTLN